jgi:hypothetical protein
MGGRKKGVACSGAAGTEYTSVIGGCGAAEVLGVTNTDRAGTCAQGHLQRPDLQVSPVGVCDGASLPL